MRFHWLTGPFYGIVFEWDVDAETSRHLIYCWDSYYGFRKYSFLGRFKNEAK
jgi:hypothetical protein